MAVLPARSALVGRTENKQLNITLTTGLFGSTPQVVAAQINLGSEKLAANVETTLNNADLTGLLKMLLPQTTVQHFRAGDRHAQSQRQSAGRRWLFFA